MHVVSKFTSQWSLVGCSLPSMRLAQYLTALRAWCTRCLTGLRKTRRAPSQRCRHARVYGHTAKARHGMSTPPLSEIALEEPFPSEKNEPNQSTMTTREASVLRRLRHILALAFPTYTTPPPRPPALLLPIPRTTRPARACFRGKNSNPPHLHPR